MHMKYTWSDLERLKEQTIEREQSECEELLDYLTEYNFNARVGQDLYMCAFVEWNPRGLDTTVRVSWGPNGVWVNVGNGFSISHFKFFPGVKDLLGAISGDVSRYAKECV